MTREQFINELAKYVQKYAPKYGIKVCSPIIAQSVLESGAGTSELAVKANNFFGLKYKAGRCPSASGIYYKVGSEQNADGSYTSSAMQWCKFDSMEDCVVGYFDFISIARYSNLKSVTDPKKYLENIKADGYATSLKYVDNVYNVIQKYNLTKFDVKEENVMTTVNNNLEIRQCILTNNRCYKQGKKIVPKGIVVHSTGANNPSLKRYVQPDDGILGKNSYANHWNNAVTSKCVHAFIGKDKDGVVRVYQTLPWDYRCWGCGSGKKGSYNDSYIQFEICEDALTDSKYFNEAFNLAIELCAYLAKKYGIAVENIVSHNEANKRGYASNHGDCDHWLKKFSRTMDWFRTQVGAHNNVSTSTTTSPAPSSTYTHKDFVKEVQAAIGAKVDGIAGNETLSKTITVSKTKNRKHAVVKPIQKYLNSLGFDAGIPDSIAGAKFDTAVKAYQKANGCIADGEVTSKMSTWKKLLKLA